ncbi:MAG: thermonuclease family protein [Candidatus Omnitrophica bacterium]|nr:thermonuclease family protein [Candidatus Omnitrophota bacterium]
MPELAKRIYSKLIADLKVIRKETEQRTRFVVNMTVLTGYWKMGKRMSEEKLPDDVASRRVLLERLATDLDLEYSFLTRCMKFHRLWPKKCPAGEFPHVGWSQYKAIFSLPENKRSFYLSQADEQQWNTRELLCNIKHDYFSQFGKGKKKAVVGVATLKRREEALHIYAGRLERIIDGDTFIIAIDLGFTVWTHRRIRLRGIDTPEAGTPEGEAARQFVTDRLFEASRVVLQTFKIDIYGRYVCDLFYLPGETDTEKIFRDGHFLNQELLDQKIATVL